MERDSKRMRGEGPFVFAQIKHGEWVERIAAHILHARHHARGTAHTH